MNFILIFTVLILLLVFTAQPVFCFGLKSKVQDEIDQSPFLQEAEIKLRVISEKNGYLSIEMYEGKKSDRSKILRDFPLSELEDSKVLQSTIEVLKKIEGVKAIKLTAAIDTPRDKADELLNEASKLLKNKEFSESVKKCTAAIQLDPNNIHSFFARGDAYKNLKNYKEALSDYDKATELDSKHKFPKLILVRGFCYHHSGDYQQAIKEYNKYMEIDPKNVTAAYNLGRVYALQGNVSMACTFVRKALALGDHKKEMIKMIIADVELDKIRNESCFQELMKGN
jgi:tetratricopeptide (TPR) repeat protein